MSGFVMLFRKTCLILLTCLPALCTAAEPLAIATVVDGDVVLVRHTSRLVLKPGVHLLALDLIETAPSAAITRIEFVDGAVADLGPDTRVMVSPSLTAGSKNRLARLYALYGWVKVSAVPVSDSTKNQVISASMALSGISGSTVMSVQPKSSQVFVESGSLAVTDTTSGKPVSPIMLKSGNFYSKSGSEKASVSPRPTTAFMAVVPKSFLDPVPLRASVFQDRPEPVLKALGDLNFAQAMPWLSAEIAVRNMLVKQWQATLGADLRKGLLDNISSHSEWRSVLLPGKTIQ
jgi:hypothetical protein